MKADHVAVSRPGQVVALDTTVLPVKVREGVLGDPVSAGCRCARAAASEAAGDAAAGIRPRRSAAATLNRARRPSPY
jgi:hypothetical protein